MSGLQTVASVDTWVEASWNEYLRVIEDPIHAKAKGYFYDRKMRIEMSPVGHDHASAHTVIMFAINLFAAIAKIPLKGLDNCTYRKPEVQECQPDFSCYLGENTQAIPKGINIVDLDVYPVPDLVVEVAKTSLSDDLGTKRLAYEDLGVKEYWVVDVEDCQITAFAIANSGSSRITESQILPGLKFDLLESALRQSWESNQSQACNWLLLQLQQRS